MKKEYRNVIKTKKAIKVAFTELINQKNDINKITVVELIKKADIAKSTFYLHYDDIYSVIEEFENELLDSLNNLISNTKSNYSSFEHAFDLILKFIKENENTYTKLINSSSSPYFIEKLKHLIVNQLFYKIDLPRLSSNQSIKKAQIMFFVNGTIDLVVDYFKGNLSITLEELKEIILNFIQH